RCHSPDNVCDSRYPVCGRAPSCGCERNAAAVRRPADYPGLPDVDPAEKSRRGQTQAEMSPQARRPLGGEDALECCMTTVVLAAVFLPLSHFLISSTRLRASLINLLGERRYSTGYSLLAAAALAWLFFAYSRAPAMPLWDTPRWLELALIPVVVVSCIVAVAGLTPPNPVIVRSQALFDRADVVRGVLRITRNPFFWGVGIFSIAYSIILGNVAALLTFGSLAVLGLVGASILDAKKARQHGKAWSA